MTGQKELENLAVAVEIERFLRGESDGAPLFQALYGAAAEELVPQRLLKIVREGCEPAVEPELAAALAEKARGAGAR